MYICIMHAYIEMSLLSCMVKVTHKKILSWQMAVVILYVCVCCVSLNKQVIINYWLNKIAWIFGAEFILQSLQGKIRTIFGHCSNNITV